MPKEPDFYRPKCHCLGGGPTKLIGVTIPISTPGRKRHPGGISKARTWTGHNQKMAGAIQSCTGRAWWTGRGWAVACPGRSYLIWKLWRPWPQERCNTSRPSTGSTWRCGVEGYWFLGGWGRRRSPSWKEKQGSAQFQSSLHNKVIQHLLISHHAYLLKAENVGPLSVHKRFFINKLDWPISIFCAHFIISPIIQELPTWLTHSNYAVH